MTPKLTAENAIIRTATVEVKTLTISGRQVTLAVFRQLPEASIIEWQDGYPVALKGIPWGRINYHPDKCEDSSSHFHIVWQYDQTLYRCRVETFYFTAWDEECRIEWDHKFGRSARLDSQRCDRDYKILLRELQSLDQLFIAV